MTVDAGIKPEIRLSEGRSRDRNAKAREAEKERDRIPLGSNKPLSLHASLSNTAVLKVQQLAEIVIF